MKEILRRRVIITGAIVFFSLVLSQGLARATNFRATYGGAHDDGAYSIQQTSDCGYIVTGLTNSFGAGIADMWVLKLDGNGNIQWQETYGGANVDQSSSIQQTSDGGYIVAGLTGSFGAGNYDILVLKLDGNGDIGGTCSDIIQTTSVTPGDSSAIVGVTSVVPENSNATVTTTSFTPQTTSAITNICTDSPGQPNISV